MARRLQKIPKRIIIFGVQYAIELVPGEEIGEDAGEIHFDDKIIKINNDNNLRKQNEAFFHEIGHGICYETGINQAIEDGTEETLSQNFSTWIMNYFYPENKKKSKVSVKKSKKSKKRK